MVADDVPCGPDIEKHLAGIRAYEQAGFDELYIQQIGPRQDEFFNAYREQILPQLQRELARTGGR
jgi:hypothetical protein